MDFPENQGLLRVYLAMPTYDGGCHYGSHETGNQARFPPRFGSTGVTVASHATSSSLCFNYNRMWCEFYELWKKGECDGFAMLHSDIQVVGHPYVPQGRSWLDFLWDKMQEKNLSCLSTVMPIKNRTGETSLAAGLDSGLPQRKTLSELSAYPPTFTDEDFTEGTLLVNTGLMLIKPEEPWVHDFAFDFTYKNVDSCGVRIPTQQPEDWLMSKFFKEKGVRYGATTEIKALHHGTMAYPNWEDGSGLYVTTGPR